MEQRRGSSGAALEKLFPPDTEGVELACDADFAVKNPARMRAKVDEYRRENETVWPRAKRLSDCLRASVVTADAARTVAAYEALSSGMQQYLDGLVAVHDFSHGFKESLAEPGGRERLADAVAANPPVRHPVVQTHPETGKKVLFVNALFTTHIEGLPPLESAEVLQFLWRHASLPEFTCRFHWQPNSMVLWDNRSTQHKPVNDFFPATRRLHRVVSEGDQPY